MRSRILAVAGVVLVGALALINPATAATSGGTTTTFSVTAGLLSITVPGSVNLGSYGGGASSGSVSLGTVTVDDARSALTANWTATVSSTNFLTGGGSAAETIATSQVSYWSGPATATTGVATFTPGQAAAINALTLATPRTAFSAAGTGDNSASWAPSVILNVPVGAIAGAYTGTITHSVA